jgi:luciferase family oxidoreductase group 1
MIMADSLHLSVLDLVGLRQGESAAAGGLGGAVAAAVGRSVDLARHAEQWGYTRFWMAEHHSIAGLACSATSVLIGHVAGATKTIRVGSGGVMLPNHAPLVVAEQFGTLEALYPGRIDLGLGRAPGGDWQTMRALRRDLAQTGDDFPELLAELQRYLGPSSGGPASGGLSVPGVRAIPGQGSQVPITLLGSSTFSAQLAAEKGLPFAFAAHFAPELLKAASRLYREEFREGSYPQGAALTEPYLMVAVPVIAAETDAEARRLFTSAQQRFLRLVRGQSVELVAPLDDPEAMEKLWRPDERAAVESRLREAIVGSKATVKVGLEKLVRATGADEVIVVTDAYDHADRLESYRRVAEIAKEVAVGAIAMAR